MFRQSFVYYMRSLLRRKLFSFINITGLAWSIAFMILIGQYLYYESKYNRGLKNVDNIYRLVDGDAKDYNIDYTVKDRLREFVPGVRNASLLFRFASEAEAQGKFFPNEQMAMVDSSFFDLFHIAFIYGNSKQAFNSLENVVLTATTARKYFGTLDAVGRIVRLNHQSDFIVTGVVRDVSENLSVNAELFVNYANSPSQKLSWRMASRSFDNTNEIQNKYLFSVFVELESHADVKTVEQQISSFNNVDNFRYPKSAILAPLKTNYLDTQYVDYDLTHGNIGLVKLLSIIGFIILLLAIINFINLTTAAYRYRLTEFGVRKCLGADRKSLVSLLIRESFFTTVISSMVGIVLAEVFLPYFNQYIDKQMSLQLFIDMRFLSLFIGFVLFLSFSVGIVPSILLSKISPLQLFNYHPGLTMSGKGYRSALTMIQFSIAIILITGLVTISKQIDFVKHRDIGFNSDKLLYLRIPYTLERKMQTLSDKLHQYHGMKSMTKTFGMPGETLLTTGSYAAIVIDSMSLKTFGFQLMKGRNLLPGDKNKAVFINQTALKQFKDKDWMNEKINGCEIAGVVSDFHYSSLRNRIGPLVLWYCSGITPNTITMRVSGPIDEAVSYINKTWKEVCPDYPVQLNLYDEYFASMYKQDENLASLVSIFSILAVIISCMGIFGLSVFQSEQRIKEIGIRKVVGASVFEIIFMLTQSFSRWVLLANIIAVPIAYYVMNNWLQDFAYRIDLNWWMFAFSGGIVLMIALITVSFQAIKAAIANPVESLRYE